MKYYYHEVLAITEEYLGPAARRFLQRQSLFHLDKEPELIVINDIIILKENIPIAFGVIANDKKVIDDSRKKFDDIIKKHLK